MFSLSGIDVSRYQGEIDWQLAAGAGVGFAMIKALQGSTGIDKMFTANASGAQSAGIPFGVYVYSKAKNSNDAEAEARAALDLTSDYELYYPIALDFESAHFLTMEHDERADIIAAFCSCIKSAGAVPMLYSNKNWLTNFIPADCLRGVDVWLAQWRKTPPDYTGSYTMWQYGRGRVEGIEGSVDMDICYYDYAADHEDRKPLRFEVTTPRMKGDAVLAMQKALIAANYRDESNMPLEPDGIWGAKSQAALDKLVRNQSRV